MSDDLQGYWAIMAESHRRLDVEALLASLGDRADEVALALAKGGYRGDRGCNRTCPLALFLRDKTGELWEVGRRLAYGGPGDRAELPQACRDFVCDFDHGGFGDCLAKAAE